MVAKFHDLEITYHENSNTLRSCQLTFNIDLIVELQLSILRDTQKHLKMWSKQSREAWLMMGKLPKAKTMINCLF